MSYSIVPITDQDKLYQGDIIRRVVVVAKTPSTAGLVPDTVVSHVIVMSHPCEIDKPDKPDFRADVVHVARVIRLDALPPSYQGNVRGNIVHSTYYLPIGDEMPLETYIDWRSVQPVDKSTLIEARATGRYKCTVVGDLLVALSQRFWDFFFRADP